MKTGEGMFRGTELGKNLKEIKAIEGISKPKDEDVNYLYYEFPGDTGELYTVEYNFDERGLDEIRMDAYFVAPADAHSLFLSFRDYYTAKYGPTEKFEGYAAWAFKLKDGKTEQIELSDESAEYRQGKFSLQLYYLTDGALPKKPEK